MGAVAEQDGDYLFINGHERARAVPLTRGVAWRGLADLIAAARDRLSLSLAQQGRVNSTFFHDRSG